MLTIRKYRKLQSVFIFFLSFMLVFSSLPMAALAAHMPSISTSAVSDDAVLDINIFKIMNMQSAANQRPISTYYYLSKDNYYHSPANMSEELSHWYLNAFSISHSQEVSLVLYEMDDVFAQLEDNPIFLDYNPDDAYEPEEFLGKKLGYLYAVRIEDNIDKTNAPDRVDYYCVPQNEWSEIVKGIINSPEPEYEPMIDIYAYSFDGLPYNSAAPMAAEILHKDEVFETASIEESPITEDTDDYELLAEEPFGENDFINSTANPPRAELDMVFMGPTVALAAEEPPDLDGKILNYYMWNGLIVENAGAEPTRPEYDSEKTYVIVMEPTLPVNKYYNSFLAFHVDNESDMFDLTNIEFQDLALVLTGEPVNLLTGSFAWDYTDISLYGKFDLPFIRYYESKISDQDFGLGYGWTTNYTYKLEMDTLFAKIYLPRGETIYFDLDFDGTYITKAGSALTFEKISDGYLLSHRDGTRIIFDSAGNIQSITCLNGDAINYAYSGNRVSSVANATGKLSFSYNNEGQLTTVSDNLGRNVQLTYQGDNLAAAKNPDGDSFRYSYDGNNCITKIEDFKGNLHLTNEYNDARQVVKQFVQDEGYFYFTYDTANRTNTCTGENGYFISIVYDRLSRIIESTTIGGTQYFAYNDLNQRISETDKLGNLMRYEYDASGNITKKIQPDGFSESFMYNAFNQVTQYTDCGGNKTTYNYDSAGNLISKVDALGNTRSFTYDSNRNVSSVTNAEGNTTAYTYDNKGNMLSSTDALGRTTRKSYDEQGRLLKTVDADGYTVDYEYTPAGKLLKATDPKGNEIEFDINADGFNTDKNDRLGYQTLTEYTVQNKTASITNALDEVTNYTYDEAGNLVKATDASGGEMIFAYDADGRMISYTNAIGNTWTWEYDSNGKTTLTTNPLGYSSSTEYDSMGRKISETNGRDAKTSYSYDAQGNRIRVTDALGNYASMTYDAVGNLISETDKNGNTWHYAYDGDGRLTKSTDPLSNSTVYTYDAVGNQIKFTTPLGFATDYLYNNRDLQDGVINPLNHITTFNFDELGQVISVVNNDGTQTYTSYDANGNALTVTDELGYVVNYEYDVLNRLASVTDARGNSTKYTYDELGNLISTADALNGITAKSYNTAGNLLSTTDADGNTTNYEYDAFGRVIKTTDAKGGVTLVEYDANGNIIKIIDAEGYVVAYEYDLLDQLVSFTDAEGYTTTFFYDPNGNVLSSTNGNGHTTSNTYDGLNRAIVTTNAEGNTSQQIYDADGRLIKSIDEEGAETSYAYDANNRLIMTADAYGNKITFTYDKMDRLLTETDARGGITTYTYTARGQVATLTNAEGYVGSFTYDGNGNMVTMTTVDGLTTFTYDALNRVTSATEPDGNTISFTYDGIDRITSSTDKNGNTTRYIYDGNGNIVETIDALNHSAYFEYNRLNQLTKMTLHRVDTQDKVNEKQVTLYYYDGRGLVTRTVNAAGNERLYVYDGNGNLVSKTDEDGYVTEYSYTPLDLVSAINYDNKAAKESTPTVTTTISGNNVTITVKDGPALLATKVVPFMKNTAQAYDVDSYTVEIVYNGGGVKSASVTGGGSKKGKNVSFAYNKVGELVQMKDWNGITTYEIDLLRRITEVNDHKGNNVQYGYDEVGNQTSIVYPDNSVVNYTYDLVHNLSTVIESNGRTTSYDYDGMRRITKMSYPNGWVEEYTYDAVGNMLSAWDIHPSEKPLKTLKMTYTYDPNGNLLSEFKRGNGTGQAKWDATYTYDALNRLTSTTETHGSEKRIYTYDSLGNITYETGTDNGVNNNKMVDYILNNLNQIVRSTDDGWKTQTDYTYDKRGNLIREIYTKNKKQTVTSAYIYDETNRMVSGTNEAGEVSNYIFNGLGMLVRNEWLIEKNNYGYHDVQPEGETVLYPAPNLKPNYSTVIKEFVLDYTSPVQAPLTEHEVEGFDYRYVYGNERLEVMVSPVQNAAGSIQEGVEINLYYHQDRLGTTDYLTSAINSRVISWTSYNEWGRITHNAVLKCGNRELDMVKNYTGHEYDSVLNQYYAKARMYDPYSKRFTAVDVIKGSVMNPQSLVRYIYVEDNPLKYVDPIGLFKLAVGQKKVEAKYDNGRVYIPLSDVLDKVLQEYGFTVEIPSPGIGSTFVIKNNGTIIGLYPNANGEIEFYDKVPDFGKSFITVTRLLSTKKIDGTLYVDMEYFKKAISYVTSKKPYYGLGSTGTTFTLEYLLDYAKKSNLTSKQFDDLVQINGWTYPLESIRDVTAQDEHPESAFGTRTGRQHGGVDFYTYEGCNVLAMADGNVLSVSTFTSPPTYYETKQVSIKHNNGFIARYGELTPKVLPGNAVNQGQVIGTVKKAIERQAMLHLEIFTGELGYELDKKPLSTGATNYYHVDNKNYQRRADLLDPTFTWDLPMWTGK